MKIHHGYERLNLSGPVVTIGIFDGVHRGHRSLLDRLSERAGELGGQSVAITFDPHPRTVLDKSPGGIFFLSPLPEKTELLEKAGLDHLVIIRFTLEFSRMRACDFVNEVLINKIGTRNLVIGHDHRFGFKGEGSADTIRECAERAGIELIQVEGLSVDEETVSSSLIRNCLTSGRLEKANSLLGYTYSMKGTIVGGKKIGRDIGFPTANIKALEPMKLLPSDGVYAVEVKTGGKFYKGMLNIGINPTVSNAGPKSIEVNIFDFGDEIYGEGIEVFFRFRLRDEIRFSNIDELVTQLKLDREKASRLLS